MKRYSEIRGQLSTGDVVLFHRQEGLRGWLGWVISKVTGSPFTHCGIALWLWGRVMLVEAREGIGVTMRPLSDVQQDFKVFQTSIRVKDEDGIVELVSAAMGKKYDWLGALLSPFKILLKNERYFCSQFVGDVLYHDGFEDISVYAPPAHINNYLEKQNIPSLWVQAPKGEGGRTD